MRQRTVEIVIKQEECTYITPSPTTSIMSPYITRLLLHWKLGLASAFGHVQNTEAYSHAHLAMSSLRISRRSAAYHWLDRHGQDMLSDVGWKKCEHIQLHDSEQSYHPHKFDSLSIIICLIICGLISKSGFPGISVLPDGPPISSIASSLNMASVHPAK